MLGALERSYGALRARVLPGPKQFADRKPFEEAVAEMKRAALAAAVEQPAAEAKADSAAGEAKSEGDGKAEAKAAAAESDPFPDDTAALLADFVKRTERDAVKLATVWQRKQALGGGLAGGLMAALKKKS